jgi:hypothetical protein
MDRRSFFLAAGAVVATSAADLLPTPARVATAFGAVRLARVRLSITTPRGPLTVDEPTDVVFSGAGRIVVPEGGTYGILVRSSDVTITDARIDGPGSSFPDQNAARTAIWLQGAPAGGWLERITITGGTLEHFGYAGVRAEYVRDLRICGVRISDIAYAGVQMLSVVGGTVSGCEISDLTHDPYPNSYGIAATRNTREQIADAPRCERIEITGNVVRNVPRWEGIDTHGGVDITIADNTVIDCATGIALVPLKRYSADGKDDTVDAAPLDCVVRHNTVTWTGAFPDRGAMRAGINFVGAGAVIGDDVERATGSIVDNTISGYGSVSDPGAIVGAMLIYTTRGLQVTDNEIVSGYRRGIVLYHSNDDIHLLRNTVSSLDVPAGEEQSGYAAAYDVRTAANDVMISESLAFTDPPRGGRYRYGVYAPGTGSTIRLRGNSWGTAEGFDVVPIANRNTVERS